MVEEYLTTDPWPTCLRHTFALLATKSIPSDGVDSKLLASNIAACRGRPTSAMDERART